MTKTCAKCSTVKEPEDFYRSSKTKDGRNYWCKSCQRAYYQKRVKENPDYFLRFQRVSRAEKRKRATDAKVESGCADCGERHLACLEFHHLDPSKKELEVMKFVDQNAAWETIEAEMAKCIVLCCNCHRIRHYNEREAAKLNLVAA